MRLAKLLEFDRELAGEHGIGPLCANHTTYYRVGQTWNDVIGNQIPEASELVSLLEKAHSDGDSFVSPKAATSFFPVNAFECVIVAQYPSRTASKKRVDEVERQIRVCERYARALFESDHHDLTGLPNRRRFSKLLSHAIQSYDNRPRRDVEGSTISGVSDAYNVYVLAIDIDHFKQVNDTYGHLYGDAVLMALGARLDSCSKRFIEYSEATRPSDTTGTICVSHPSGEEFLVLLTGDFKPSAAAALAENMRSAVAAEGLPSDDEAKTIHSITDASMPDVRDRRITISVGVARYQRDDSKSVDARSSQLKQQADAALYRAKSAGRNTVRTFDEIMDTCGRVLEHDADAGVVAIDIGSLVGVQFGQGFRVYNTKFNGDISFNRNDSRSTKKLGTYPRVCSATIAVFDVQKEISFCRVSRFMSSTCINVGAIIEPIPLGEIVVADHDVDRRTDRYSESRSDLLRAVRDSNDKDAEVAVFSFRDLDTVRERRGVQGVNELLASLRDAIFANVSSCDSLYHISPTRFASIVRFGGEGVSLTSIALGEKVDPSNQTARVAIGRSGPIHELSKDPKRPSSVALDAAELALEIAISMDRSTVQIDSDFVLKCVQQLRDSGRFRDAHTMGDKAIAMGYSNAMIHNAIALVLLEEGRLFEEAIVHAENASRLDSKSFAFSANRSALLTKLKRHEEAIDGFNSAIRLLAKDQHVPPPYLTYMAESAIYEFRKSGDDTAGRDVLSRIKLGAQGPTTQWSGEVGKRMALLQEQLQKVLS